MKPPASTSGSDISRSATGEHIIDPVYIDEPLRDTRRPLGEKNDPSMLMADRVESLAGNMKVIISSARVAALYEAAERIGHWAVMAAAGLTLVYAIYGGVKFNSFSLFLAGIIMTGVLAVAQYVAIRFLKASADAISQTRSHIASLAFPECAGLLAIVAAVALLVAGVISAIQIGSLIPLLPALLGVVVLVALGGVALNPELVNTSVVPGNAADEAIGLIAFLAKAGVKVATLFFSLLSIGGGLALLASFFRAGQSVANAITSVVQWLPISAPLGLAGAVVVLVACLMPIASYFVFIMEMLWVSVVRAVLATPREIAELRKIPS